MKPAFRLISLSQEAQWNEALATVAHSYWHSWRANEALRYHTASPAYLYVATDAHGATLAACAFAERAWHDKVDIYTAAGFTGFVGHDPDAGVLESWREFVASRGYVCGYFALHPMTAVASLHAGVVESHTLYCLDLAGGLAAVMENASRTVRRSLNDWRKGGSAYVTDRGALQDFLVREYPTFMKERGAAPHVIWSEATLRRMLEDPSLLVVGVADDAGICAAYSFAVQGIGSECHLNVSVRDGRRYTTALLAWGIDQLARAGVRWLNLGGGSKSGDAIAQAKEKLGPAVNSLLVAKEIYDAQAFRQLCEQAGCDATAAGFFPPYRAQPSTAQRGTLPRDGA